MITNHARERAKKRIVEYDGDIDDLFEEAKIYGKTRFKNSKIKWWLQRQSKNHNTTYIVYKRYVFWVGRKETLVTVTELPYHFWKYSRGM